VIATRSVQLKRPGDKSGIKSSGSSKVGQTLPINRDLATLGRGLVAPTAAAQAFESKAGRWRGPARRSNSLAASPSSNRPLLSEHPSCQRWVRLRAKWSYPQQMNFSHPNLSPGQDGKFGFFYPATGPGDHPWLLHQRPLAGRSPAHLCAERRCTTCGPYSRLHKPSLFPPLPPGFRNTVPLIESEPTCSHGRGRLTLPLRSEAIQQLPGHRVAFSLDFGLLQR